MDFAHSSNYRSNYSQQAIFEMRWIYMRTITIKLRVIINTFSLNVIVLQYIHLILGTTSVPPKLMVVVSSGQSLVTVSTNEDIKLYGINNTCNLE